ncbi:Olfactory receptor 5D18 [Heterocephalus glaber]|uniref:Olfactory receptor 5D18 n=1 Tax=Heterocephalus glaber TaxID=10181 RepID=G5BM96_HETGA|nr:Olfactory receptor 5D18 [Heterocephalus glaber]
MAYDRFVAICNPLLYTVAMSQKLCAMLVVGSYSLGAACSLTLTCSALQLSFRGFNIINHFFFTILKMRSASGRHKAFSTCASHLTAISIFYGTIFFLYCVPSSKSSIPTVRVASVFYTMVIPMLNPLIYSLRNKEVKDTVCKFMNTKLFSY